MFVRTRSNTVTQPIEQGGACAEQRREILCVFCFSYKKTPRYKKFVTTLRYSELPYRVSGIGTHCPLARCRYTSGDKIRAVIRVRALGFRL